MSPRLWPSPRCTIAVPAALVVALAVGCGAPDERERGRYDPREPVASCLRDNGVAARLVDGRAVDASGVRIEFLSTPGQAEARQIEGRAQGAEQIGRALIWVGGASEERLATIEKCVDR
jgi:hypothetical protein